jgi:hypothetical protein
VSGVPSGPANAGGVNNTANDPSGVGNANRLGLPASPGTNSAGTAQASGSASSSNARSGVTTGAARQAPGGVNATGPRTNGDAAIDAEDQAIDRKIKSICRGC